ncbi:MAG: ABC transporter substrate-binding protein/permease [Thermoguttaceae bacterium]|nr:ABC transporter substrate-binding protein/permease [Thermoguttaceae bacterium]
MKKKTLLFAGFAVCAIVTIVGMLFFYDKPVFANTDNSPSATADDPASENQDNATSEKQTKPVSEKKNDPKIISSIEQLNDPKYTVAVQMGTSGVPAAFEVLPKANIKQLESDLVSNCMEVETGKVDAFLADRPTQEWFAISHPKVVVLPDDAAEGHLVIGAAKGREALIEQVNEFIRQIKADGTYQAMYKRWLLTTDPVLPDDLPKPTNPTKTLKIVTEGINPPLTYIKDGKLTGYDIEFALRFAAFANVNVEFEAVSWDAMIVATQQGQYDLMVSELDKTPENAETMALSDDYLQSGLSVMILRSRCDEAILKRLEEIAENDKDSLQGKAAAAHKNADEKKPFYKRIAESFYRNLVYECRWKLILNGFGVTMLITACSLVLGTLLGFLLCMVRRSHNAFGVLCAKILIRFIQGTPLMVLLMLMYYVIFVNVNAILVAIFGFSVNLAVYFAESLRGGLEGIDPGQLEAASAMGFTRFQRFRLIKFPQLVQIIMPVYKGEIVSLLKETAIVGYISIQDLTRAGVIIRSLTYEPFFPLVLTAIIYLVVAYTLIFLLTFIEHKTDPKLRPRVLKGVVEQE